MEIVVLTSCRSAGEDDRNATPIRVPKHAPIVLVRKLRGDAKKTPRLITVDPAMWFIPYT